jgi:transposase-like protein
MRKNQKYTQAEMQASITKWRESGLTQHGYCKQEQISTSTFSYWVRKLSREQMPERSSREVVQSFIPVELPKPEVLPVWQIEIGYPDGVQVRCAAGTDISIIKALIGLSNV